ncbi:MAG: hypothetical protein M3537_01475 [Chloroflexota bacterium]|nr:hypothetical protein [Chloroflexota bacterium]
MKEAQYPITHRSPSSEVLGTDGDQRSGHLPRPNAYYWSVAEARWLTARKG